MTNILFENALKRNIQKTPPIWFMRQAGRYHSHYRKLKEKYTFEELLIIGSLLEKEGKDNLDKKLIFSVIQNRLKKNMKLQIDATTIYAITDGKYDLNRNFSLIFTSGFTTPVGFTRVLGVIT